MSKIFVSLWTILILSLLVIGLSETPDSRSDAESLGVAAGIVVYGIIWAIVAVPLLIINFRK